LAFDCGRESSKTENKFNNNLGRDMTQPNDTKPPQWLLKLMRFFVKKEYLEEIAGDMEEIFRENAEKFSVGKAKRLYAREMLKLLRPNLVKNLEFFQHINQLPMFKNYIKVSVRGLLRNPLNSFINLFGLAAAISFCVFAYAFARWTYNRDQFHENKNMVFLTTFSATREGVQQQYGQTPRPLADLLKQDFPQVKKVCRVEDRNVIVKHMDNVFNESIRYTDPDFLEMFTFPLKWGTSSSLIDVNSIVLSEPMSIKYFGDENPIGQSILVKFDKDRSKEFKITGVAQAFPNSRSLDFHFLINVENLRTSEPNYDFHDWSTFLNATLIQVADPADIKIIESGMEKYKRLQNSAVTEDWAIASFAFEPLATVHLKTDDIRDDIFRDGSSSNITSIGFLSVVCLLMLVLACFNYINIAIVSAAKRLKELGVRKTIGASRRVIIIQFLSENILTTSFALMIGLVLAWLVVIPWFEGLWNFSMDFRFADPNLWIYLPAILLVTGIASGIYPSIYISRFQTVNILKGSLKFGHRNPITKIFLGFQLVLACVFITSAVMFTKNADYLAHRSWGYSNRDVLYAVVPDELSFEQLNATMAQNPKVHSLSGSVQHIGKVHQPTILHFPDRELEADMLSVGASYFKTMGLELISGRTFHEQEGSDKQAVVVNETMVKNMHWDNAIGKQFKIDSINYDVIGVVKDFHSYSFYNTLSSTIFKVADKKDYRYLSLKVTRGAEQETYASLKQAWTRLFPETPFTGGYQEDVWGNYYTQIGIHGHVWQVFASVAVLLAGLGLYGLVSLNVSGRIREFSIRKVLGANFKNIAVNIFKQYYILFISALTIGVPLSYFSMKAVLDFAYKYHMPITFGSVALAASILIVVLIGTVSTQVTKVFKSNPVDGLKIE
jgi:ABC-type antimicrobial peptide transport system permease subunit